MGIYHHGCVHSNKKWDPHYYTASQATTMELCPLPCSNVPLDLKLAAGRASPHRREFVLPDGVTNFRGYVKVRHLPGRKGRERRKGHSNGGEKKERQKKALGRKGHSNGRGKKERQKKAQWKKGER